MNEITDISPSEKNLDKVCHLKKKLFQSGVNEILLAPDITP